MLMGPVLAAVACVAAQAPARSLDSAPSTQSTAGNITREIHDPASGSRWLLVRPADHPGGPGRLLLVGDLGMSVLDPGLPIPPARSLVPVIHAGDALLVEEHTGLLDARLEAVALGPARKGAPLRARLKLGGRIVRVIASGPGRASLASVTLSPDRPITSDATPDKEAGR
jgi:hypothetical protein